MDGREVLADWEVVRRGLTAALDVLSDDELRFQPREGLWSLGTVALHVAACEEGWLRHALHGRRPPSWEPYTLATHGSVGAVKEVLARVHADTVAWLAPLSPTDLARAVDLPWGGQMTVRSIVWHVLEHEIHHRGEVFLMLGLLGHEAPDI